MHTVTLCLLGTLLSGPKLFVKFTCYLKARVDPEGGRAVGLDPPEKLQKI